MVTDSFVMEGSVKGEVEDVLNVSLYVQSLNSSKEFKASCSLFILISEISTG